jgi:rhamnogalacturonyl hydrolase YesR
LVVLRQLLAFFEPPGCRTPEDPARHKETAHYQTWRDTVAEMMAEPCSSVKYGNVFPDEMGWG